MVSTGLKPPLVTWTEASATQRLSWPWTRPSGSVTDERGVVAHPARARLVLAGGEAGGDGVGPHRCRRRWPPATGRHGLDVASRPDRLGVGLAGQRGHRSAGVVDHVGQRDPVVGAGDLLDLANRWPVRR